MRPRRTIKGKGVAPIGYVFCKGEKWKNVQVCVQCRYRKRCLRYKEHEEQTDGKDKSKRQLPKGKSNKVARRTRKRRSK